MKKLAYIIPDIQVVAFPELCKNGATGSTFDENGNSYNDPIDHGGNNGNNDEGGAKRFNMWDSWDDFEDE